MMDALTEDQYLDLLSIYYRRPFGPYIERLQFAKFAYRVLNAIGSKCDLEDFLPGEEIEDEDDGIMEVNVPAGMSDEEIDRILFSRTGSGIACLLYTSDAADE